MYTFILTIGDWLFSWLLMLPRDVATILIGSASGVLLGGCRIAFTNVRRQQQIRADLGVLKKRLREVRQNGDAGLAKRYRRVRTWVRWRKTIDEVPALLVALPVLLIVSVWMEARTGYFSPQPGDEIEFEVVVASTSPELIYLVPQTGLQVATSWIQSLAKTDSGARARWRVTSDELRLVDLQVRWGKETMVHRLRIGGIRYEPPVVKHEFGSTRVSLRAYRPFGLPAVLLFAIVSLVAYCLTRFLSRPGRGQTAASPTTTIRGQV